MHQIILFTEVMKTLEDYLYDIEERAAIEMENGATEESRSSSIQSQRRVIRDALVASGMGLLEANMEVVQLERKAGL